MEKSEIKTLEFRAPNGFSSSCQYIVAEKGLACQDVVIMIQAPENSGMSVTNASEVIATQLSRLHGLQPLTTLFIEHYPAEGKEPHRFDVVEYRTVSRYGYANPKWHYVRPGDPVWTFCVNQLYGGQDD